MNLNVEISRSETQKAFGKNYGDQKTMEQFNHGAIEMLALIVLNDSLDGGGTKNAALNSKAADELCETVKYQIRMRVDELEAQRRILKKEGKL